jgi:hypothetical protein
MPEDLTRALTNMIKDPKIFLQGYIRNYLPAFKRQRDEGPKKLLPDDLPPHSVLYSYSCFDK